MALKNVYGLQRVNIHIVLETFLSIRCRMSQTPPCPMRLRGQTDKHFLWGQTNHYTEVMDRL